MISPNGNLAELLLSIISFSLLLTTNNSNSCGMYLYGMGFPWSFSVSCERGLMTLSSLLVFIHSMLYSYVFPILFLIGLRGSPERAWRKWAVRPSRLSNSVNGTSVGGTRGRRKRQLQWDSLLCQSKAGFYHSPFPISRPFKHTHTHTQHSHITPFAFFLISLLTFGFTTYNTRVSKEDRG